MMELSTESLGCERLEMMPLFRQIQIQKGLDTTRIELVILYNYVKSHSAKHTPYH